MTEKDTSETTAGNQDKIQLLSNLRYIPKKNLIPIPYKNAGKAVEKRISFKQLYLLPRDERKP